MKIDKIKYLLEECISMELEDARSAGKHGYMCRCLVIATMPHRDLQTNEFERTAGTFKLNMIAPAHVGLPYGPKPRLIMAFISRQAVLKENPVITLGHNLTDFMRSLGLDASGRSIEVVKDQMNRLFNTTISYRETPTNGRQRNGRFGISSKEVYFWNKDSAKECQSWESTITLTNEFYKEIVTNPVSLDLRALAALKGSSLGLDIYCWLTYRMSYLKRKIEIPWGYLMLQFGSEYQLVKHFKEKFLLQLKHVLACYPRANVYVGENGLVLYPSQTHIHRNL